MMISIQNINFPLDCKVTNHNFFDYDPVSSFIDSNSLKYLNEDLFQCAFPNVGIIIDLGWYGDVATNVGGFRIYIIQDENWEIPVKVLHSKSVEETKEMLVKILKYYSQTEKS